MSHFNNETCKPGSSHDIDCPPGEQQNPGWPQQPGTWGRPCLSRRTTRRAKPEYLLVSASVALIAADAAAAALGHRGSLVAGVLASYALLLSLRGRPADSGPAVAGLVAGVAVLLLRGSAVTWVLVLAGCLAPLTAIAQAVAAIAVLPRAKTFPPTPTELKLQYVISGGVVCVLLMVWAGSSSLILDRGSSAQLHVVGTVGWLLLPSALLVPALAHLPSSWASAHLRPIVTAGCVTAVAATLDGGSPVWIAVGLILGSALAWLASTPERGIPAECPLEWADLLRAMIRYSVLGALAIGFVMLVASRA
jgi:hypothetical protein